MLNDILFTQGQSNTSSTLNLEVLHTNYLVIIKNECVHSPLFFFAHLMVLYAIYDHDEVSENETGKGQLILKADWPAIDSPKKRTDEFDLFAVKSKKAKKSNSDGRFLVEVSRP